MTPTPGQYNPMPALKLGKRGEPASTNNRHEPECSHPNPRLLPSEPMLLANLRIYFADFPECTFLYVPEHLMLGDLMR